MSDARIDQLYSDLAVLVASEISGRSNALLYVVAESGVLSVALFDDVGDYVEYKFSSDEIDDKIDEIWYAEEEDNRWRLMLFHVKDRSFNVTFFSSHDVDLGEGRLDRRDGLVAEIFGDKPIKYPD